MSILERVVRRTLVRQSELTGLTKISLSKDVLCPKYIHKKNQGRIPTRHRLFHQDFSTFFIQISLLKKSLKENFLIISILHVIKKVNFYNCLKVRLIVYVQTL